MGAKMGFEHNMRSRRDAEYLKYILKFDDIGARETASRWVYWCCWLAMHEHEDFGKDRLERTADTIADIQKSIVMDAARYADGGMTAFKNIQQKAAAYCDTSWPVRLLARPKKSGDLHHALCVLNAMQESAEENWCVCILAFHKCFGFGRKRLERLKSKAVAIYEELQTELYEEGEEVAVMHMKKGADQLFKTSTTVMEETTPETKRRVKKWRDECFSEVISERIVNAAKTEPIGNDKAEVMKDIADSVMGARMPNIGAKLRRART